MKSDFSTIPATDSVISERRFLTDTEFENYKSQIELAVENFQLPSLDFNKIKITETQYSKLGYIIYKTCREPIEEKVKEWALSINKANL